VNDFGTLTMVRVHVSTVHLHSPSPSGSHRLGLTATKISLRRSKLYHSENFPPRTRNKPQLQQAFSMLPQHRQVSGESAASHDTELSEIAGVVRRLEDVLREEDELQESEEDEEGEENEESEGEEDDDSDSDSDDNDDNDDVYSAPDADSIASLHDGLSVNSQITTISSFAERMQKAKLVPNAPFQVIGRGSAGTVFEIPGTEFVLKKGSVKESIWADSQLTNTACTAVMECKSALEFHFQDLSVPRVPRVQDWVKDEDLGVWWEQNGQRFVNVEKDIDDTKIGHIFCVQRILPLPQRTREGLIRGYFPPDKIDQALHDPRNKSCLVRPYLGQRRDDRTIFRPQLSLENYPLYLDQMLEIKVDVDHYACEMAIGLAVVHWRAQIDGMDMEFVIGSSTGESELPSVMMKWYAQSPLTAATGDFRRRSIHLWILDFDKANQINFRDNWRASRDKMVTAVTANDPYYPNPVKSGQQERAIWKIFESTYIKAAKVIINIDYRLSPQEKHAAEKFPKEFIKAWTKRAQKQLDEEEGGFVEFG
jgi:hypothetical protein